MVRQPAPAQTWTPPLPEAPGFEHTVVETPGLRSHVATIGEGEPVVMLHGFPEHWWQWREVAPVVAAAGYRVYCPDLRGAGWTSADDPHVERTTRLRDVVALLDALGIDRCHLVSHDMGCVVAMQLTYEHPERVRTAVQLAVPPAFFTFSPRIAPGFFHLREFIWHRPGVSLRGIFSGGEVAQEMTEATKDAHLAPFARTEVDAAVRPLTNRHVLREAVRMMAGHYRRRRLTVPTLVVYGREDHPWTEANLARICRHPERFADRMEFAFVDGASHFITDDQPEAVARQVLGWIERAWPSCSRPR